MWFFRKREAQAKGAETKRPRDRRLKEARLPVSLLQPGMRLTGLDRPWEEVPVLFQGFVIRKAEDIRTLRQHCRWVLVEGESELVDQALRSLESANHDTDNRFVEHHSIAKELPRAQATFEESRRFINEVFQDIRTGKDPDLDAAKPLVRNFVQSVNANAYALFWLSRVKERDAYTAEHCLRVSVFAISFAHFLGMSEEEQELIGLCGLLHDIGKIRTPDEVLNKPGRLTPEEFAIMKEHPVEGYRMLCEREDSHPVVKDVTLYHHERLDGTGYPEGLTAERISRHTRLISIIDVYDAITSSRVYKEGKPANFATNILYEGRGTQFDAEMVEAFIRMVGVYPVGSVVKLTTGDIALVSGSHPNRRLQPQVEVVLDRERREIPSFILDLADEPVTAEGQPIGIARPLPDHECSEQLVKRIETLVRMQGRVA
ncbi:MULTISPECIES: HD-GYP domain-containing protein [Halomonadaceae]|uniref:HD-GYP domain-containing protein n=1 Tax=Halomonadaceae TaxID=28256 RepID=UPI0015980632|nr:MULTISPECIES: HD-GYP domain-containing protein [Halomonas]QJQ94279.1 HD-GYP domain-containing protein [Halomonas sp. PA5]